MYNAVPPLLRTLLPRLREMETFEDRLGLLQSLLKKCVEHEGHEPVIEACAPCA